MNYMFGWERQYIAGIFILVLLALWVVSATGDHNTRRNEALEQRAAP